jgi:hypothetical protein
MWRGAVPTRGAGPTGGRGGCGPGVGGPRLRWHRSRWRGRRSCRTRRSGRNWTGASASACGNVLPAAGSVCFCRRVRRQGNRPRASRLGASGAGAEWEWRTGAAAWRGGPAGGCSGMPAVLLEHARVSRGGSAHEQEDPAVRVGAGIANKPGSIISYPLPIAQARPQHLEEALGPPHRASSTPPYAGTSPPWQNRSPPPRVTAGSIPPAILHALQPPGKLLRHPRNLATVELLSPPFLFAVGNHPPPVSLPNQGHPKVRHDPLNLPSIGDPLRWNVVVFFLSSVFLDQGLNCFDLESSGAFSVKFPELSLFQISELLNSI